MASATNKNMPRTVKFLTRFPVNALFSLALQFILGIYINMYVIFPEGGNFATHWDFVRGSLPILAHIFIGLFIFLSAIAYLVVVLRTKHKRLVPYAAVGLVAIAAAIIGGERFVSVQIDGFSMLMALGFISAIVTYALAARIKVDQ